MAMVESGSGFWRVGVWGERGGWRTGRGKHVPLHVLVVWVESMFSLTHCLRRRRGEGVSDATRKERHWPEEWPWSVCCLTSQQHAIR